MNNKKNLLKLIYFLYLNILLSNQICNYCQSSLDSTFTKYKNKIYHQNCFDDNIRPVCSKCNKSILSEYKEYDRKKFHPMCYKNIKFHRCQICSKQIKEDYIEDLWGNALHKEHMINNPICFYCNRILSERLTNGGYQVDDGRYLCTLCQQQSIVMEDDIEESRVNVLDILEEAGFENLSKKIKIFLVNQQKMSLYSGNFKSDHFKGFTKSMDGEYVIYIINHTPKLEFEAILAHEYLHIWQYRNNIKLNEITSEGISCIGNMLIYNYYDNQFSKVKLKQINSDNFVYVKGYKKINKIIDEVGLKKTINLILKNKL